MAATAMRPEPVATAAAQPRSMRWGAWCGALLIVLTCAADAVFLAAGIPDNSFTARQISRYFIAHGDELLWVHVFFNLASIAFIFFVPVLYTRLREAEGGSAWLSKVAAWGALLAIAGENVSNVFGGVGANFGHDYPELTTPGFATSMFQLSIAFNLSFVGFVALQVAVGVLSFQTRVFPRWIAWLGLADVPLWLLQQWPVPRHDNALQELLFDRTGPWSHLLQMVWLTGVVALVIRWTYRGGVDRAAHG